MRISRGTITSEDCLCCFFFNITHFYQRFLSFRIQTLFGLLLIYYDVLSSRREWSFIIRKGFGKVIVGGGYNFFLQKEGGCIVIDHEAREIMYLVVSVRPSVSGHSHA